MKNTKLQKSNPKKKLKKNPITQDYTIAKDDITPEQALIFLEGIRQLMEQKDLPTTPISLRIPANLLNLLKSKAKIENKKYQSLIIEYIRKGLTPS